eukprot:COSAG03_NODE_12844_length_528_cov_1.233100_2_plen_113_part_01
MGENAFRDAYAQFAFEIEPLERPSEHLDWVRVFVLGVEMEYVEPGHEANDHGQHKQHNPPPDGHAERKSETERERERHRQREKETERQRDRQTDRQTERQRHADLAECVQPAP